jgi:two-component system, LytTR family, response regulator
VTAPAASPAPLRVLVADDEPAAREGLAALLAADPEVEVVATCADGREAAAAIDALAPDVVFLDVQMPEGDGFEVLARAVGRVGAGRMPVVVFFVTAYDEYALRAFEVSAVDYLLKPFDDERLLAALREALHDAAGVPNDDGARLARFVIRETARTYTVPVRAVDWIEGADYYARLHAAGRSHLLRESLASLERRLDPRRFHRVHRSAIVNLARVHELRPAAGGAWEAVLHDGTRLPVARGKREALERALERAEG